MSWLRIGDEFASHPKIAQLTDREFRVWMRTLCFCARYQDPTIDEVALIEVPGLTKTIVTKLGTLGLIDVVGDKFEIHDWAGYQPKDATGAERQAKWRARHAVRSAAEAGLRAVE